MKIVALVVGVLAIDIACELRGVPNNNTDLQKPSRDATSILITKGEEVLEMLKNPNFNNPNVKEIFEVRLGRIIVAVGEFGSPSKSTEAFLTRIENDAQCQNARLPDWLVFVQDYRAALERIGRDPKTTQERDNDPLKFEIDRDLEWGLGKRHTLSTLAFMARGKLKEREIKK